MHIVFFGILKLFFITFYCNFNLDFFEFFLPLAWYIAVAGHGAWLAVLLIWVLTWSTVLLGLLLTVDSFYSIQMFCEQMAKGLRRLDVQLIWDFPYSQRQIFALVKRKNHKKTTGWGKQDTKFIGKKVWHKKKVTGKKWAWEKKNKKKKLNFSSHVPLWHSEASKLSFTLEKAMYLARVLFFPYIPYCLFYHLFM